MTSLAIKKDDYDTKHYSSTSINNLYADQQILNDYLSFFTKNDGADLLQYVYMESSDLYDNLIKNCSNYYLCKDEIEIISKSKNELEQYLSNITDIIEVGPGSAHAVNNKTLPILSYAKNLKRYHAIDYSKSYLESACTLIKSKCPNLNIFQIEADLIQLDSVKISSTKGSNKAALFLGSTLGNFNEAKQENIIKQFASLLDINDLFILTVDTNQDKDSLLKAYSNDYFYDFTMGCLKYYAKLNPDFKKYLASFEAKVILDERNNLIDAFFKVKEDLSFYFIGHGNITLNKGQELRGIISQKPSSEKVKNLLFKHNFEVLHALNNSDKMKVFICKRI